MATIEKRKWNFFARSTAAAPLQSIRLWSVDWYIHRYFVFFLIRRLFSFPPMMKVLLEFLVINECKEMCMLLSGQRRARASETLPAAWISFAGISSWFTNFTVDNRNYSLDALNPPSVVFFFVFKNFSPSELPEKSLPKNLVFYAWNLCSIEQKSSA